MPCEPSGDVLRCVHVFALHAFQAGYKPAGRTDLKGLCSNQRLRFLITYLRREIGNAAAEIRRQRAHGIGFRPTRFGKDANATRPCGAEEPRARFAPCAPLSSQLFFFSRVAARYFLRLSG